jgi:hypothetical protein
MAVVVYEAHPVPEYGLFVQASVGTPDLVAVGLLVGSSKSGGMPVGCGEQ